MSSDGQITQPMEDGDGDPVHGTYGRFQSRGVLGRGGMGVVLRAKDPELDRDVAIKLLAPGTGNAEWLQREAQAMAKLAHPNVVTVFETGVVGKTRFIVMELVDGTTLRAWLNAARRSWSEIVTMFVACGRGLAAAHAAGLVHRDFKPDNVLIGSDGRPRVSDFGLVGSGIAVAHDEATSEPPDRSLTVRGSLVGTPAYMAPEQWLGTPVDPRTDQFAFCVALWEALYGERPFGGDAAGDLRASVLEGVIGNPASDSRDRAVPRRIDAALRRGLERGSADRWPALEPLLAELEPRPRARWPVIAAIGVLGAVAAVTIVAVQPAASDPCPDPTLAGIWDDATRTKIDARFMQASPTIARETVSRVATALDDYASKWSGAVRAACRATHVEGTQSDEQLDLRMICLERRRAALATLTRALTLADHARVRKSIDAVGALGDVDACANREMLRAQVPPTDAVQRVKVEELERELLASAASKFEGKSGKRQARAAQALATARTLGYLPTLVRALEEHYSAANDNDDEAAAMTSIRELALKASEAHDDALAARAWTGALVLLSRRNKIDEAKTLEPVALAAVERAGGTPNLRFAVTYAIGLRQAFANELAPALATLTRAADMAQSDLQRAEVRRGIAQVTAMKDGPKNALAAAKLSLDTFERAYGPSHPRTAEGLHVMAQLHQAAGDLVKAAEIENRALAIREAALGPDHGEVASSLHTLGNLARMRGDKKAAVASYERAITIRTTIKDVNGVAITRGMLATVVAKADGIDAARPIFVEALAGLEATTGKDNPTYLQTEANFASALITAKKCDEAMPLVDHAAKIAERMMPRMAPALLELGAECDLQAKRVPAAIAKFERALAVCENSECPQPIVETVAWNLGKTLVETGGDRKRAIGLIDRAQKLATEHGVAELVKEIVAWRTKNRL